VVSQQQPKPPQPQTWTLNNPPIQFPQEPVPVSQLVQIL
jgi:hypothetical protein